MRTTHHRRRSERPDLIHLKSAPRMAGSSPYRQTYIALVPRRSSAVLAALGLLSGAPSKRCSGVRSHVTEPEEAAMPMNYSTARELAVLLYDEPLARVTELKRI